MGMRGHLRQITLAELQDFQRSPKTMRDAVRGKNRPNVAKMMATFERLKPVADRARAMNLDPSEQEKVRAEILKELAAAGGGFHDGPDENGLNLEKSWHVLHYLLTGKAEDAPPPLGNAILGGHEIGGDLGYGPARFLAPDEVRGVAAALATVSKEDLAARFDLDAMIAMHIYPVRDDSELEMAQHYFEHLSRYYAEAAASGNAMLLCII